MPLLARRRPAPTAPARTRGSDRASWRSAAPAASRASHTWAAGASLVALEDGPGTCGRPGLARVGRLVLQLRAFIVARRIARALVAVPRRKGLRLGRRVYRLLDGGRPCFGVGLGRALIRGGPLCFPVLGRAF